MEIWHLRPDLNRLNHPPVQHMGTWLGISFTDVDDDALFASMPVNERTRQPLGILHGGASVVLAETIGSVASYYVIDPQTHLAVGMEINANHLRPVRGVCSCRLQASSSGEKQPRMGYPADR